MILVISLSSMRCSNPERQNPKAEATLRKACKYLWEKQGVDGGWHSETYGFLKGGEAWTPFVLFALLEVPDHIFQKSDAQIGRALDFLRGHVNADGVLGVADPEVLEYPNYATAYALRVLVRYGKDTDKPLIDKMRAYLAAQQFTEQRGFAQVDLEFGGWGFGETNLPPRTAGFVDLSHTRRILQALREAGHDDQQSFENAKIFLRLLQKHPTEARTQPGVEEITEHMTQYDGGFYFSPVILTRNKAGRETDSTGQESSFRSYATATCDGALALVATGLPSRDERVQFALEWLRRHPALDSPEGIPEDVPEQWHKVMFFYHLMVRSEVYNAFDTNGTWQEEIADLIEPRQRPDGSFSNPYGELNKEDDPMLATAMVVVAIANAMK